MLILGVVQIAWLSHCRWFLSERNGAADSRTLPVNVLHVVDLCYWTVLFGDVQNGGRWLECLNPPAAMACPRWSGRNVECVRLNVKQKQEIDRFNRFGP